MRSVIVAIAMVLIAPVAASASVVINYHPTSITPAPQDVVAASITFNASQPFSLDVTSKSPTISFGGLIDLAFSIVSASGSRSFHLSDFTAASFLGFPLWHIQLSFLDDVLQGTINFVDATNSDDFSLIVNSGGTADGKFGSDFMGICPPVGRCSFSGEWDAVPEPATLWILVAGLLGVSALRHYEMANRRARLLARARA
jgi:hypothetical protein